MADEDVRRQADDLARHYTELNRRLAQTGLRDVGELVTLAEQLRRACETLGVQELLWARDQAQALVERLLGIAGRLHALRRIKAAVDGQAPP